MIGGLLGTVLDLCTLYRVTERRLGTDRDILVMGDLKEMVWYYALEYWCRFLQWPQSTISLLRTHFFSSSHPFFLLSSPIFSLLLTLTSVLRTHFFSSPHPLVLGCGEENKWCGEENKWCGEQKKG